MELPANAASSCTAGPAKPPTSPPGARPRPTSAPTPTPLRLRDKYESKATKLRDSIAGAEDRVDVLEAEADGKRNSELLSTAGSILGGLLGGRSRSGMLGKLGTAAGKHGSSNAARQRVDAAEGKVARLTTTCRARVRARRRRRRDRRQVDHRRRQTPTTIEITLERSDVTVTSLTLAWMPVT